MRYWHTALVVLALAGGFAPPIAARAQQPPPAGQLTLEGSTLRGFTITLVLGDVADGRSSGTFTPAATNALADLKGFLPYKSYRLLDTVWILGLSGPHQFLHGLDGRTHEFSMYAALSSPSAVRINGLKLWAAKPAVPEAPPELLIDTNFNLKVGETIVVGTSRIDGTTGLILLVTAAPK